jgi:predicted nucleic acid-binding protein
MVGSPKPHIVDASVLIDLEKGVVIRELFLLHHGWTAPDLVIVEVGESLGSLLTSHGLTVSELQQEEIREVERLRQIYKGLSITDLSCLVLAKSQNGTLIAGDQALRRAAEQEGLRVRGTLWILDEMVDSKIFLGDRAADALDRMIQNRGRFPPEEISKRMKRWIGKT